MIKIDKFGTYQGSNCFMGSFRNYFKFADIDIEEHEIFFLADGFYTSYKKWLQNGIERNILFSDIMESAFKFCDLKHIDYQYVKNADAKSAEETMIQYLANNVPIVVKVISNYLTYNNIFRESMDVTRFISITGLDTLEEKVYISDAYIPLAPPTVFEGWTDYSSIRQGREAAGNGYIVFNYDSLKLFEKHRNRTEEIKNILYNMRESLTRYLRGGKNGDEFSGVDAVDAFIKDIPELLERFGDSFTDEMCKISNALKIFGVITNRYLLYKALSAIYDSNHPEINRLCGRIYDIYKDWNSICLYIVKIGFLRNGNYLNILAEKMKALNNEEIEIFNNILMLI